MSDRFLITDTHPLLWYMGNRLSKLPKKVLAAFNSAKTGSGTYIWVPAVVVWEISLLMKKTNRFKLASLEELLRENFFSQSISVTDLQAEDILNAHSLNFNKDPFDALIVGTAQRMEIPLITEDSDITDAHPCAIFWD